ncbi:hypothetical protein C4577_05920 [Candidatus Parcubacteria bacterium]|nr:MAG: hypothetical protein C4577_05920 [Candidatus Parcubacteria bacterium]
MTTKTSEVSENMENRVAKFVSNIILFLISLVLGGYVLTIFWQWFAVSTFNDLPSLTIPQALGLFLIGRLVVTGFGTNERSNQEMTLTDPVTGRSIKAVIERKQKDFIQSALQAIFFPMVILVIGWIFHLFM